MTPTGPVYWGQGTSRGGLKNNASMSTAAKLYPRDDRLRAEQVSTKVREKRKVERERYLSKSVRISTKN